ncbi:MAG: hypothetical protein ACTH9H_02295 [Galactobacter sp.]
MSVSDAEQQAWEQGYHRLTGKRLEWVEASPEDEAALAVVEVDPQAADRLSVMPKEGVLSEAPMGEYDVFELSVFARPVAQIRWCVDGDLGLIGSVIRVGDSDLADDEVLPVLVEAALDEAWQAGADHVVTLVPARVTGPYQRAGWQVRAVIREA